MKTITIVLSDLNSRAHLHGMTRWLDDHNIPAEINEYQGDVRPVADPRIVVTIEGGAFQGAMANLPIAVEVFDVDNLKAEGKDQEERNAV